MVCHCCDANSGAKRISPAETVFMGQYWLVEHAYPTSLKGWMVIVLRRHCENLHDLTRAEWRELADLQFLTTQGLKELLDLEREYTCCFAEMEGFKHLHFHVIPKLREAGPESTGVGAFHHLKVTPDRAVPAEEIRAFCAALKARMETDALSPT